MTTRALLAGVVVAASAVVSLAVGCVDEDPVITGHRPADDGGSTDGSNATDATAPVFFNTVTPGDDFGDAGDVDDPLCRRCNETLSTDTARGTLCRHNDVGTGKSSVVTLNDVVDCVCYDKCAAKCGNYCAGGKTDLICSSCITQGCADQIAACQADNR